MKTIDYQPYPNVSDVPCVSYGPICYPRSKYDYHRLPDDLRKGATKGT